MDGVVARRIQGCSIDQISDVRGIGRRWQRGARGMRVRSNGLLCEFRVHFLEIFLEYLSRTCRVLEGLELTALCIQICTKYAQMYPNVLTKKNVANFQMTIILARPCAFSLARRNIRVQESQWTPSSQDSETPKTGSQTDKTLSMCSLCPK